MNWRLKYIMLPIRKAPGACRDTHRQHRFGRRLTEFSYRFNRRFSLREMFPRLAYVALRASPMPYRVLKLAENYA